MKFLHEFLKCGDGTVTDNGWWEIRGNRLVNEVGGYHYYSPDKDDIIVEVNSRADLDWSCLLVPDAKYGWLDLRGHFYGCRFQDHETIARLVLKTTERELEKSGWVKLYRNYPQGVGWYCEKTHMTKAQRDFLIGRNLYEDGDGSDK